MMKNKKGQEALEFLMTYGWAILVVLIAIGILTYLGLFEDKVFATENNCFCEQECSWEYAYKTQTNNLVCPINSGWDEGREQCYCAKSISSLNVTGKIVEYSNGTIEVVGNEER